MDPIHAAQYNWQRIGDIRLIYRMNVDGNILEGPLFSIDDEDREEGIRSGYFKSKGRWYAVDKQPSEPVTVTLLKGVRVHFNCHGSERHIRIVRQYDSENIPLPFSIELEMA